MVEVEVFGAAPDARAPSLAEVRRLCRAAAAAAGVHEGHVAIEFVDAARIERLNSVYRAKAEPTDVLSFPIDGAGPLVGSAASIGDGGPEVSSERPERELGDVVICPEHTADLREAIVHGMLHLLGMDHETDAGEMLALQRRLLRKAA